MGNVDEGVTRLPRELVVPRKTNGDDLVDLRFELIVRANQHTITCSQRPSRQGNRSLRIDPTARQSGVNYPAVIEHKLLWRHRFLGTEKRGQVFLGIKTHYGLPRRGNMRRNVSTERTPATIATGEEHQRLRPGVGLLIELQLDDRIIPDGSVEVCVRDLMRHLLRSHVMIEPLIPDHSGGGGHDTDRKS